MKSVTEAEAVKQFTTTIEQHGADNVVVLAFLGFEMEALRLVAQRTNEGDVVEYVRESIRAAAENDLNALVEIVRQLDAEWAKRHRKGGAR